MKLYFDKNKITEIIAATESGTGHIEPYTGDDWGVPERKTPGLMLVGDQGVYLMGNEQKEKSASELGLVAYAKGCDPRIDKNWWENKQAFFGVDDGAEFLSLEEAKHCLLAGERPFVELTPESVVWGS
ncbi:DUF3085 domain-containing protein [Coraliomargarita parva]|uniref:DUF3085 domain-containing protein n=1 Tax=Coraliomargarita parva TaxID=3014050 RepID=UPI0022B5778F|nr:DUF3085 domain-containing protein [Coraliomargarita parva]